MIRSLSYVFVALLVGCAQPMTAQQIRPDQLNFPELNFAFPVVENLQLTNGMRLYLKEDHELPLVDMTLMIGGGSIEDPLDKTGLSQLFAAVLETGGAGEMSPLELETELEAMAAKVSVSSSAYNITVNISLHENDLQRGLEILADMLRRPRFDAERLELARKQMLESIRRQNDDPGSLAARLLHEAIYPQHPFGSTPQVDVVESFSRADLLKVQQRCLQPDNIWFAVSGAVDEENLVALVEQNFADWQATDQAVMVLPKLPPAPAGRVLVVEKKIPQTSIMLGHRGINKDNPDQFALRVANYILGGGGFNSRMMREIRSNRGLAYSVYSYFKIGRRLPEMFIARSETQCGATVEVVELMRGLMQQIREEPVSAEELELAKKSLINSFVFAFSDTHSIVSRKVRLDFYDYPKDYLETYQEKIAAVTIEDIQRVARQYLHPEQLQIVLVGDTTLFSFALDSLGLPVEKVQL